jgi:hypothetical protein
MDFSPQPTNSNPPPLPILKMDEQKPLNRVDIPPVPAIVVTDVTVPKKPDGIVQIVKNTTSAIWKLHWECRNGPWKLGPINTTLYERFHLEENILELLEEILQVQNHHRWIYVQLQFFIKPVLYAVGGHVINRAVLRGIHLLISEDSITKYLVLFRESFWPNDQPCPPNPIRSESEKARIRQLLEDSISLKIKGISL